MNHHLADGLSAYLDDELAPAARGEAKAHLEACADCRAELQQVASARAAVRALPIHTCPPAMWDSMVGPYSAVARRRRVLWATAAAAAAVVAVLLPREPRVSPSLPTLVDSHAARASVSGDPLTQLAPIAVPVGHRQ